MKKITEESNEHKRLIMAMVHKLMREGFTVSANHIGYPNGIPEPVNNYIPDIYAKKGNKEIIIEAKTCDSLNDNQTRLRWFAFSNKKGMDFSIIVPEKCAEQAKRLADKWKIDIKRIWKLEI